MQVRFHQPAVRAVAVGSVSTVMVCCGCSGDRRIDRSHRTSKAFTVERVLAPAPASCPGPKARRQRVSENLARLVGRSPVWAGFYARLREQAGALHLLSDAPRTADGWRMKVLWVIARGHEGLVRLQGRNVQTGARLRFQVVGEEVAEDATLDPAHPPVPPSTGPTQFPSYVYVPGSGCYDIESRWPGGSWHIGLGVGS